MKQLTTTLLKIAKNNPHHLEWQDILKLRGLDQVSLEQIKEEDTEFPVSELGKIGNLQLLCWSASIFDGDDLKRYQQFAIDCANSVRHLMTDERSTKALDTAQDYLDGKTTEKELKLSVDAAFYSINTDDKKTSPAHTCSYYAVSSCYYIIVASDVFKAACWAARAISLNTNGGDDLYSEQISKFLKNLCDMLDGMWTNRNYY